MKVSNKGLVEIVSHEGLVLKPYLDSVGVWTIGVGHTKNAGGVNPERLPKDQEISINEAMEIFSKDIGKFEERVNKYVTVPLEQHQFDALVSFDFNTGGIHRAKLLKSLNNGNYEKAAAQFMGWKKPPEIIPRRTKEMELFRTGKYGDGKATLFDTNNRGEVLWGSGKPVDVLSHLDGGDVPVPPKKPVSEAPKPVKPESKEFSWSDFIIKVLKAIFGGK